MTDSPRRARPHGPEEDRDLVTFIVPRVLSRSLYEWLTAHGLTVAQAPSGVSPMAEHDTHLAIPGPDLTQHYGRLAARFTPIGDPAGTFGGRTRIIPVEPERDTTVLDVDFGALRTFTLDAVGTYCTACTHPGSLHNLVAGSAIVVCSSCECRTRHP